MKVVRENRNLRFVGLPTSAEGIQRLPSELTISIEYTTDDGNDNILRKAISLDNVVIPMIVDALAKASESKA